MKRDIDHELYVKSWEIFVKNVIPLLSEREDCPTSIINMQTGEFLIQNPTESQIQLIFRFMYTYSGNHDILDGVIFDAHDEPFFVSFSKAEIPPAVYH